MINLHNEDTNPDAFDELWLATHDSNGNQISDIDDELDIAFEDDEDEY